MGGSLALKLALGVGLASVLAYFATPVAILAAKRFAFYDRPVGHKAHAAPTPYLGGAAVVAAFVVAVLLGAGELNRTLPLIGGVGALWAVGTVDDRRNLSPLVRVLAELILAVWMSLLGHGWQLGAGPALDALVNGIWVVGVINAFNLFDNMDGAASTMALVVAAGACALGIVDDNRWAVIASATLAGACLGFLPHNLARPARIFLGDGGSMAVGFAIAVIVASSARGAEPSLLSLITGLMLVGLPALDTTLVIVSRRRRGVSILRGGQDHLTHRTRQRVRTARRVALVLGATQALISTLVIIATRAGATSVGYLLLAFVVGAGVTILALERALESTPAPAGSLARPVDEADPPGTPSGWFGRIPPLALIVIGLGAGLSAFLAAYYNTTAWIPIGFVVVVLAAVGTVIRPPRVELPTVLLIGGTGALGLLSLLSSAWASSAESATTDANRWMAYAALALLVTLLARLARDRITLLGALGVGIALVAASVTVRLLGSAPGDLFVGGRLNAPLGYINGEACVFAMGVWLAVALAERREAWLAGLGAGLAVVCASLTLLSQSRGAAIATAVALVVSLVVFPGARRRLFALALILLGLVGAGRPLLDVYRISNGGAITVSSAHHAAAAMLLAAVVVAVGWGVAVAAVGRWEDGAARSATLARWGTIAAVAIVALPVAGALLNAGRIERTVSRQWHSFVHTTDQSGTAAASSSQSRLLTGAGNRYDYWRVAWKVFEAHPLGGVGAGNYMASYYRYRRTQEAIENPHSLELQTLSELGLAGALVLGVLVLGVGIGIVRLRRHARSSPQARGVLVAAGGAFCVWLVDTSGDWMHRLPGVAAVALCAAAVLCLPWPAGPAGSARDAELENTAAGTRGRLRLRPRPLLGGALLAALLAVAGGNLLRQGLSQHYLTQAQHELARRPATAIEDAVRALRLDAANVDAYYTKAAGQARFDRAVAAQQSLQAAAAEDPQDFVTWVLLGDLSVRRRNYAAAAGFYGRAHALDPGDPQIARLARDPAAALTAG